MKVLHKNRKKVVENRTTFNELHNTRMKQFDDYYKTLPTKETKLGRLQNRLKKKGDKMDPWELNKLKEEIKELKNEIHRMRTQEEMTEYLLSIQSIIRQKNVKKKVERRVVPPPTELTNVNAFLVSETDNRKKRLLNDYLIATGGCPIVEPNEYTNKDFSCDDCKSTDMIVDSVKSSIICGNCGLSKDWQDPNLPQWSDHTDVTKTYRYQREQYFIDHLNRFQGKENVNIDNKLIQRILIAIHKRRIKDKKNITSDLIRSILKDLNETEYYDHINSILRRITGKKAPQLTQEVERKLILMFNRTIEPFEKWKTIMITKGRMNFLAYHYVIRKLLRILVDQGYPELECYISHFRLLKCDEKVKDQEKVWKKICKENDWPFFEEKI